MRKHWASALLLIVALQAHAQLPTGSIAPDFVAKDLTGKEWRLYDLLDQGKIVVLEFSATWCPPCWAYHIGHAMHNFYTQHGPEGDDRARVLFIEGDPATNENCLNGAAGCNNYTPGSWVAGTPFPIINDHTIADTFQIQYYPTIFIVCPNRKVYEVGQWNAANLWEQAVTCPVAYGATNAGIFDYSTGTPFQEICDVLTPHPAFSLVNLGSQALKQATLGLFWNGNAIQTIEWTGYLGLYGEAPIAFDQYPVSTSGALQTRLLSVNNAPADDDTSNNTRSDSFTLAQAFPDLNVLLKIRTDQYGPETYWELRDAQGAVLESGGNQSVGPEGGGMFTGIEEGPGAYGNNTIIRDTLHLPAPGCYSIHFVDAYGDGMCCEYGNGYYKLFRLDDPLTPILSGGAFRAYDDRAFSAGFVTSTPALPAAAATVQVYPNPAGESIYIDLSSAETTQLSIQLINAFGQAVLQLPPMRYPAGEHQFHLQADALPDGWYALCLRLNQEVIAKKILLRKR
ncbi:MAG: redoxin domain-containing protein [Saprospirales bacterium]|jgi:thiol-disulfide isomerase/thioredoxin|nr:redoxin domain-containing protein [Saprospirales bacterium]MBK8923683.1 redoxin domain-containing protein [Saprospirales bacterium]